MAALIPDFDQIINLFIPFEHGIFTHTLIGGFLFTLGYTGIIWIIGRDFFKENSSSFLFLLGLTTIGMLSHLLLDSFTFYYSYESSHTSHMYFWPIWDFPVHINTMFPGATWEIRVLVEVLFSIFLAVVIIIYGWLIKHENPLLMFSPEQWVLYTSDIYQQKGKKASLYVILILNLIILGLLVLNYFL